MWVCLILWRFFYETLREGLRMLSEEKMTKNFTFSEKWTFPWCCQYHAKAANGHSIQKHSQHSQSVPALHESVNFSTVEEERIRASTSSNVSISLLTDTYGCKIQTYWLCVWEKGAIKVCAYIQYFFRLLLYSKLYGW